MKTITQLLGTLLILCFISSTAWAQQSQNYDPGKVFDPTFLNSPGNLYRSGNGTPGPKYFTNRANYTIHVTLNPKDTTITGRETITYINNSPDALHFLWIKLGQNLFDPHSIGHAMMPPGGNRFAKPGNVEFCCGETVSNISVSLNGETYHPKYVINDTRMQIRLHQPIKPNGGKVKISMNFRFKIPKYGSDRMGWVKTKQGIMYEIAQWYPNMEVYDDIRGWAHLPYVGLGEFYDDYGNFNYYITVPWYMIVAASGVLQNPKEVLTKKELKRYRKAQHSNETTYIIKPSEVGDPDMRPVQHGTLTWHFKMHNSRDIAWTASKAYIWDGAKYNLPNGKTGLAMSVYPKESMKVWQHSTHQLKRSIEIFSKITGFPFPWKRATNVAGQASGMEYPGIIFCGYESRSPAGLWSVTVHEIGHNWYPMIVGSNERRNMWMDEGFNTFIDAWATRIYKNGKFNYAGGSPMRMVRRQKSGRNIQPLVTRPDAMNSYGMYYTKTSLGLNILRNIIVGRKLFDYAWRSYTETWAYKHPRPQDFFNFMNNATGIDLNWFWKEWFFKTWKLDQAITGVKRRPDNSYLVTIKNKDMMVMPVLVRVWESNGQVINKKLPFQIWQRGGTNTFKVNTTSTIDSIKLDADKRLPDVNRSNNVWRNTMKPAPMGVSASDVFNHYIKAIGGKNTLKNVNDMTLDLSRQIRSFKLKIIVMKKQPGKYKQVMSLPSRGVTFSTIKVNGNHVTITRRGRTRTVKGKRAKMLQRKAIMFPELKYINGSYQTKLAGIKTVDGNEVYVVNITGPNGVKKIIYYDVDSGLKLRVVTQVGQQTSATQYSNYQSVDGVLIPFVRTSGNGDKTKVQSAKINSGISDSAFE